MWGLRFRAREWLARSWLVVPPAYVLGALVLGHVIPDIGNTDGNVLGLRLSDDAAQQILAAEAAGMIAFTGVVVSVAVLVVQFGASQYTPRLVLRFRRDPVVKHALGIFLAPALYALVSLRDVGRVKGVAPNLTVAVGVLLLLLAVLAFFVLMGRLLDLLRPRRLFAQLVAAAERAVAEVYPERAHAAEPEEEPLAPVTRAIGHEGRPGVISALDHERLLQAAVASAAVIEVVLPVGSAVHRGATLIHVRGEAADVPRKELVGAVILAEERTISQDPAFAIRTIVDIALRALSPAVNDPTTAVQALDALESILYTLAARDLRAGRMRDSRGTLRVVHPVGGWRELVELAFTEIRHYGASAPQVARRMRAMIERLLEIAPGDRRPALEQELVLLDAALARAYESPAERELAAMSDPIGLGGPADVAEPGP